MALHIALADPSTSYIRTLLIFSDNQSALRSISRPGTTSGQAIIQDILDVIQKLQARKIETKFYWVPAHTGIAGNEKAGKALKESTGWRTQTKRHGRQIEINMDKTAYQIRVPPLKAAIRATHRQQMYECWQTSWTNEVKGKDLGVLVPQPDKKGLMIHTKLKKSQSSLLVQTRTGKIGLRSFLYTRKIVEDERCKCGHTSQTVRHILMECPNFNRLRQEIWKEERRKEPFRVVEWKKMLTYPPYTKKAIDFMRRTRLLKQYQGVSWE